MMKFRLPHPGTDESTMVFSRRRNHGVSRNHPPGEAILLTRCRLSSSRSGSAWSAAYAALGAAALAGILATAAVASAPGDPVSLLASAAPAPAETASAPVAAPAPVDSPI